MLFLKTLIFNTKFALKIMLLYTYLNKMKKILIISLLSVCMAFAVNADNNDPTNIKDCSQGFNRASFSFNQGLDKAILRPIALGYRKLPNGVRTITSNFLNNLSNLVTIPNNALQGDLRKAGTNLARLGINSTVGILGMFDVGVPLDEKIAFKASQTSVELLPYELPFSSSKLSKGSSVTISIPLAKSWMLQKPFSIVACKLLIN